MVDTTRTRDEDPGRPRKNPGQIPATSGENTSVDNFFTSEHGDLPEISALNAEDLDLNIEEKDNAYIIEAELEGYDEDEINIEVQGNKLLIQAAKQATGRSDDDLYHLKKTYPDVDATVDIGEDADTSSFQTSFDGYILSVILEKKDPEDRQSREDISPSI